jgi:hypothetical protein
MPSVNSVCMHFTNTKMYYMPSVNSVCIYNVWHNTHLQQTLHLHQQAAVGGYGGGGLEWVESGAP